MLALNSTLNSKSNHTASQPKNRTQQTMTNACRVINQQTFGVRLSAGAKAVQVEVHWVGAQVWSTHSIIKLMTTGWHNSPRATNHDEERPPGGTLPRMCHQAIKHNGLTTRYMPHIPSWQAPVKHSNPGRRFAVGLVQAL